MEKNTLKIVEIENNQKPLNQARRGYTGAQANRLEMQAKFDRLWLIDPARFDPNRNCMEREKIARSWEILQEHQNLKESYVVDLGCGDGTFTRMVKEGGAKVDAVDISANALKMFEKKGSVGINLRQDYVPHTLLDDDTYDLVIALDLLANIHKNEHRLMMSELARLVKSKGIVICSTPLDIYSEDVLDKFAALMETEFHIVDWRASHHSWLIKLQNFFESPQRFAKGGSDKEYRIQQLKERSGLNYVWYKMNSSKLISYIWSVVAFVLSPLILCLKQNRSLMLTLEKLAKFISSERSISHAIFVGQRRRIVAPTPKNEIPEYHKGKKQIWE